MERSSIGEKGSGSPGSSPRIYESSSLHSRCDSPKLITPADDFAGQYQVMYERFCVRDSSNIISAVENLRAREKLESNSDLVYALVQEIMDAFLSEIKQFFSLKLSFEPDKEIKSPKESSKLSRLSRNSTFGFSRADKYKETPFLSYWRSWISITDEMPFYKYYRAAFRKLAKIDPFCVLTHIVQWMPKDNDLDAVSKRIQDFRLRGVKEDEDSVFQNLFERFLLGIDNFQSSCGIHYQTIGYSVRLMAADLIANSLEDYQGDGITEKMIHLLTALAFDKQHIEDDHGFENSDLVARNGLPKYISDLWKHKIRYCWSISVGSLSIIHLDQLLMKFTQELQIYSVDDPRGWTVTSAFLISIIRKIKVSIPSIANDENALEVRLLKILNVYRMILNKSTSKKILKDVGFNVLKGVDFAIGQVHFFVSSSEYESFYEVINDLSRRSSLKSLSLKVMIALLLRSSGRFFSNYFPEFYRKRVLRHIFSPKKMIHCLEVILRVFRGVYQPITEDDELVDPDMISRTSAYRIGLDFSNHPYCFIARNDETSEVKRIRIQQTLEILLKKKNLAMIIPHFQILVNILVQIAAQDIMFVVGDIFLPTLKDSSEKCPEKLSLILFALYKIMDPDGSFVVNVASRSRFSDEPDTFEIIMESIRENFRRMIGDLIRSFFMETFLNKAPPIDVPLEITHYENSSVNNFDEFFLHFYDNSEKTQLQRIYSKAITSVAELHEEEEDESPAEIPDDQDESATDALDFSHNLSMSPRLMVYASEVDVNEILRKGDLDLFHRARFEYPHHHSTLYERSEIQKKEKLLRLPILLKQLRVSEENAKYLDVTSQLVKCISLCSMSDSTYDFFNPTYIGGLILHYHWPVAISASHCLQRLCHDQITSLPRIFGGLKCLLLSTPLFEVPSIQTILRQILFCLKSWIYALVPPLGLEVMNEFRQSLRSIDSLCLVFLCHQSVNVRTEAFNLCDVVRNGFDQLIRIALEEDMFSKKEQKLSTILDTNGCLLTIIERLGSKIPSRAYHSWTIFQDTFSAEANCSESDLSSFSQSDMKKFILEDGLSQSVPWFCFMIELTKYINESEKCFDLRVAMFDTFDLLFKQNISRKISNFELETKDSEESQLIGTMLGVYMALKSSKFNEFPKTAPTDSISDQIWPIMLSNKTDGIFLSGLYAVQNASQFRVQLLYEDFHRNYDRIKNSYLGKLSALNKLEHKRIQICLSFSEPNRLRAIFENDSFSQMLIDVLRLITTETLLGLGLAPIDFIYLAKYISNLSEAWSIRRSATLIARYGFFCGQFVEPSLPFWRKEERYRVCTMLREWSSIGSDAKCKILSAFRSTLHGSTFRRSSKPSGGSTDNLKSLNNEILQVRKQSMLSLGNVLSLGSTFSGKVILNDSWLIWIFESELQRTNILASLLCFNFEDVIQLLIDRLLLSNSSQDDRLIRSLFLAITSQLTFVNLEEPIHVSSESLDTTQKRIYEGSFVNMMALLKCIQKHFTSLLVFGILFLGHQDLPVCIMAFDFLSNLSRILVGSKFSLSDVPSKLLDLYKMRTQLQTNLVSYRRHQALKVSNFISLICPPHLVPYVQKEIVFRWSTCNETFGDLRKWFIDSLHNWFSVVSLDKFPDLLLDDLQRENDLKSDKNRLSDDLLIEKADFEVDVLLGDLFSLSKTMNLNADPAIQEAIHNVWVKFIKVRREFVSHEELSVQVERDNLRQVLQFLILQALLENGPERSSVLHVCRGIALELYREFPERVMTILTQYLGKSVRTDSEVDFLVQKYFQKEKVIKNRPVKLFKHQSSTQLVPEHSQAFLFEDEKEAGQSCHVRSRSKSFLKPRSNTVVVNSMVEVQDEVSKALTSVKSIAASLIQPLVGFRFSTCLPVLDEILLHVFLHLQNQDPNTIGLLAYLISGLAPQSPNLFTPILSICDRLHDNQIRFRWKPQVYSGTLIEQKNIIMKLLSSSEFFIEDLASIFQIWMHQSQHFLSLLSRWGKLCLDYVTSDDFILCSRVLRLLMVLVSGEPDILISESPKSPTYVVYVIKLVGKSISACLLEGLNSWDLQMNRSKLKDLVNPHIIPLKSRGEQSLNTSLRGLESLNVIANLQRKRWRSQWNEVIFLSSTELFWISVSLTQFPVCPIFSKALKLLRSVMSYGPFVTFLRTLGPELISETAPSNNLDIDLIQPGIVGSEDLNSIDRLRAIRFWRCTSQWTQSFSGILPPIIQGIKLNFDECWVDGSWILLSCWKLNLSGLIDQDGLWHLDTILIALPWLYQSLLEEGSAGAKYNGVSPVLYCEKLAEEISGNPFFRDSHQEVIRDLRRIASCQDKTDMTNALESLCHKIVDLYFNSHAHRVANFMYLFFTQGPSDYRSAVLRITAMFLSHPSISKQILCLFDPLISISSVALGYGGMFNTTAIQVLDNSLQALRRFQHVLNDEEDSDSDRISLRFHKSSGISDKPDEMSLYPPSLPVDIDDALEYLEISLRNLERVLRNPLFYSLEDQASLQALHRSDLMANPVSDGGTDELMETRNLDASSLLSTAAPLSDEERRKLASTVAPSTDNNLASEPRSRSFTQLIPDESSPLSMLSVLENEETAEKLVSFVLENPHRGWMVNVNFYFIIQEFMESPSYDLALHISALYVHEDGPFAISLDRDVRKEIISTLESLTAEQEVPTGVFSKALRDVSHQLISSVIPQFLRSPQFTPS